MERKGVIGREGLLIRTTVNEEAAHTIASRLFGEGRASSYMKQAQAAWLRGF